MNALVKLKPEKGLVLMQVDKPTPGPGEVLIKVHKSAICGSDVHIYDWNDWAASHVKP
ncbi:MAG: alcohol dehydrogenase catalytic domain-containing protein, partial [Clostridia bacterium]|nr:alcohol dehydrogenase catalytic domain-containing protein [Clostridia bacterium]